MSRSAHRLSVLGILLLCWALLLARLDERSLWVDEFLTTQIIQGAWQDVLAHSAADIHPPLYFLALHAWAMVAGDGDFALRWFSDVAGLIGVALMFTLARRLFSERVALFSMLLLAISPPLIEFSRMARYYSWLLALGLCSTTFLCMALTQGRVKYWFAYVAASVAFVYTFYPSAVLLIAHGLCIVLPSRQRVAHWLASVTIIALAFLPWFALTAGRQLFATTTNAGVDFARSALGWLLGIAAAFYTFSVGETIFPWNPFAWLGALVVCIALYASRRVRMARQLFGALLVSIALMSFVTTYVSTGTPFLNVPVRALFALPFFVMLIGAGLGAMTGTREKVFLGALALVWMVSNLNQFTSQQFLNPIYLTPSKDAAAFVRSHIVLRDLVVSDQDSVVGRYLPPSDVAPLQVYSDQREQIQSLLSSEQPTRVWLVTIGRDQSERFASAEPVRQLLAPSYRLASAQKFLAIDPVYLQVKNFLLRRSTYENRLTVELYVHE